MSLGPESDDANPLPAVAQTNLALYKQLHRAGFDAAQLRYFRDCYELATRLFAGRYRGSGKPFVAHLVGTASVLASIGADRDTLAAGLLHAAYEQGDFGFTRGGNRRAQLRHVLGERAEELVWQYEKLGWRRETIADIQNRIGELSDAERSIVLMRLANELDDNLDLAMNYCNASKDAYRECRHIFVAMAQALGRPSLARALDAAYREADGGTWAAPLALDRTYSYLITPSFRLRLRRTVRALRGALRR